MCGRSFVARKPGVESRRGRHGEFLGLDAEKMGPRSQIATALSVLTPAALGGVLVLYFIPQAFWIVFVFGWVTFPAVGLLVRGVAGLSEGQGRVELPSANDKERELLEALREHGELTPVRAATETSLTVAEADRMLGELAEGGHLEVRARNGGLFYALWSTTRAGREA